MIGLRKKFLSLLLIFSLFVSIVGIVNVDTTYAATKKIHLKKTTVSVVAGKTYQQKLIAKNGKTIKATSVKWKSLKTSVAKINKKGKITAVKAGTAKMTAKYKGKTYKFTVKVKKPDLRAVNFNIVHVYGDEYAIEVMKLRDAIKFEIYVSKDGGDYNLLEVQKPDEDGFLGLYTSGWDYGPYSFKLRGVCGQYTGELSSAKDITIKPDHNLSIEIESASQTLEKGETKTVNVVTDWGYRPTYHCDNSNVSCKWGEKKQNTYELIITGKKYGDTEITISDSEDSSVKTTLKVSVAISPEDARSALRDYILTNGKDVTSGKGLIGDYYIESRSYTTASSNRIVICAFLDDDSLVMYSIADDNTEFCLFHNQPDVQKGLDQFQYYTNRLSLSATLYWGDIALSEYTAALYGTEKGISNCEKTGPTVVTDENELYKVYRRASDSFKEINAFVVKTMGFGLKYFGYEQLTL